MLQPSPALWAPRRALLMAVACTASAAVTFLFLLLLAATPGRTLLFAGSTSSLHGSHMPTVPAHVGHTHVAAMPEDGLFPHPPPAEFRPLADASVLSWEYRGPALLTEPAPSGINVLSGPEQQLWFFGCMALVLLGAAGLKRGLLPLLRRALPRGWYEAGTGILPLVGAVYALAGVAHFLILDQFVNMYPPPGAWGGLWQLPGTADFHVLWIGAVELVGGLSLVLSSALRKPEAARWSAWALLLLTIAVTPANIYMFTHGAQLPPGQEVPIAGHVFRAVLQMVLLGCLWEIADPVQADGAASAEDDK